MIVCLCIVVFRLYYCIIVVISEIEWSASNQCELACNVSRHSPVIPACECQMRNVSPRQSRLGQTVVELAGLGETAPL